MIATLKQRVKATVSTAVEATDATNVVKPILTIFRSVSA